MMKHDHHAHTSLSPEHADSSFTVSRVLTGVAIGGIALGAGVILAPHILPAIGIGSVDMAEEAMWVLHTRVDGSGLAGLINGALASVPLIGGKLAAGGLFNAASTALVGIGGVMLGNFIENRDDGSTSIKWGKVIKYAALATSAIIALPTALTAIGTGIIYLSTIVGSASFASTVIGLVDQTIGTAGGVDNILMGFSGIAAAIPHFLTCGVSLLPAALSLSLTKDKQALPVGGDGANDTHKYSDGSILAQMEVDAPAAVNRPCTARLRLTHKTTGLPVTQEDLAVVHMKKLHLFVADSSLRDYHHVHPEPAGEPGVFEFSFTPGTSNRYSAWADFTMLKDGQNHKLKTEIPTALGRHIAPSIRTNNSADKDDLRFAFSVSEPLQQGRASIADVTIVDAQGRIVNDLEPVMGAFAHLVGFSADGKSIIHTHPMGKEPTRSDEHGAGKLRFHIEPDCAGATQFYLQIQRHGKDVYVPFGQQIKPPATQVDKAVLSSPHAHVRAM